MQTTNQVLSYTSFYQLEEFKLHCFSDMSEWAIYIAENLHNCKNSLLTRGTLNFHHTKSLVAQLPNLIALNASFALDVNADIIFELVNNSKKLSKIRLQISNEIYDEIVRALEENDWAKSNQTEELDTLLSSWISKI